MGVQVHIVLVKTHRFSYCLLHPQVQVVLRHASVQFSDAHRFSYVRRRRRWACGPRCAACFDDSRLVFFSLVA